MEIYGQWKLKKKRINTVSSTPETSTFFFNFYVPVRYCFMTFNNGNAQNVGPHSGNEAIRLYKSMYSLH